MSRRQARDPAHTLIDEPAQPSEILGLGRSQSMQRKVDPSAHLVKRMIIQNQQRVRRQRFRFDTIDAALILKSDVVMIAIQFVISIIYLGSWLTFLLVRVPRVCWGLVLLKWKNKVFLSRSGILIMKMDWMIRMATMFFYLIFSLGFSVWLPAQYCELIGSEPDSFASCKWQVFGFRIIFILMSYPTELLMLAVVYRNATDMIFKMELRKLTGSEEMFTDGRKKNNIGYLMDPDVALNRRNVFVGSEGGSYAASSRKSREEAGAVDAAPETSRLEMSERRMLDHQDSARQDDPNNFLPSIEMQSMQRRGRLDFEFGNESDGTDDEMQGQGDDDANDQIEEIYRQQMEAAREASLAESAQNKQATNSLTGADRRRPTGSSAAGRRQRSRHGAANNDQDDDDGGDGEARVAPDKSLATARNDNELLEDVEAKKPPGKPKFTFFGGQDDNNGDDDDENERSQQQNQGGGGFYAPTRAFQHSNSSSNSAAIEDLQEDDDATEMV